MQALHIGILNIMHDKEATSQRFHRVLSTPEQPVVIHEYYPRQHYAGRPVPDSVARLMQPLDLSAVAQLDGFIVTGAPIETIPFTQITYIQELRDLMETLASHRIPQLYLCWGAMAALNHFYGITKHRLPHKLFGVYPHQILQETPLLAGLTPGFVAPHARYAEMDADQLAATPDLRVDAVTTAGDLFLVENGHQRQTFMFAHLEYDRWALVHEYRRELLAHPERTYHPAENDFEPTTMAVPPFAWQASQHRFFTNWLAQVAQWRAVQV
ncbi:homoserine O-acetyltransferase/O-succinyltransferase family protein [Levilactobacillus namurensis]|uniref:Serine O-acetyltransferase n=1 Tax=Levilactobacillus namurensis TaxID=380393 RepID=A0AAW8W969_9LACO|nr:homoserine O-succinyltransferase [Levilactobacillus namurensis]MDT7014929.1 homoserine O-succinyltransferase [Levilactobacillus namurensis]